MSREIIKFKDDSWVQLAPILDEKKVLEVVKGADMFISDIDDSAAPSPAKKIAYSFLKRPEYVLASPGYWAWCTGTALSLLTKGKDAESERWFRFVNAFLRDEGEIEKLNLQYTEDHARAQFYPGVLDFYKQLSPEAKKLFVTRNIHPVGDAFRSAANFDHVLCEQADKTEAVDRIWRKYPHCRRYLIEGDSAEDYDMLERLQFYARMKSKSVESVHGIYVAKSPAEKHTDKRFDINISRDHMGLVRILNKDQ